MAKGYLVIGWLSSLSFHHGSVLVAISSWIHTWCCDYTGLRNYVLVDITHDASIHHVPQDNMERPQIMDICDFAYYIFGRSRIAYRFTAFMLLANNILLIGLIVLTGAKILNTLSDHSICTVVFALIVTIMGIVMSIPRSLEHVSFMSKVSATAMGIAFLLLLFFADNDLNPGDNDLNPSSSYNGTISEAAPVKNFPLPGTTW